MNTKLSIMKSELKELAAKIRKSKPYWCQESQEYRFKHIAYCMLRGRTYEQIEQKTHEQNILKEHHWIAINRIIEKYSDENTLYVVVDGALSKNQQFVQGAHAVAGHCLEFSQQKVIGTTEELSCSKQMISPLLWLKSKLAM